MADDSLKTTILLPVSDPVVRSILKETSEHAGYTVLATGDLGHAVDFLNQCTPDLLMTRTYVESLPGHEAAMYLRAKCPGIRVLMLGGLLDDERLQYGAAEQGFEVFPKPYSPAVLLEEVRHVLINRALEHQCARPKSSEGRFRMAEWQYRIHRIKLLHDAELDNQIEEVLQEYGTKGWELVQVLQRHQVPEDPICRMIFKSEKTLD